MTEADRDVETEWIEAALAGRARRPHPRPLSRISVTTSAGTVSGLRWGSEPPAIVLLHGAGQNAHTWDLVVALLDLPVLAIDLPGHGRSAWRADRDYRPRTAAGTVAEALDAWGAHPDAVVGMSLGGLTALALLDARPDLVPRAALIDILPRASDPRPRDAGAIGQVALLDGPRDFASLDEMVRTAAAAAPDRSIEDLRRGVEHNATRTGTGRWRWRYDELGGLDLGDESLWTVIERSSAPLLLVLGGASPFVPADAVARFSAARPDADVLTVGGAGHAVQSTAPDALAAVLEPFVR